MLRRSVQALEALVDQQQPAMLLVRRTATSSARSSTRSLPSTFFAPAPSFSASATVSAPRQYSTSSSSHLVNQLSSRITSSFRAQTRRTFHSSRVRRSHDGHRKSEGAKTHRTGESGAANEALTLSQRLKKLSREYGWVALGVYLGLSALDFPFCFLLVRWLGTDRIAAAEHFVVSHVKAIIPESIKEYWASYRKELKDVQRESGNEIPESEQVDGWGVKEAEARVSREASLATQLGLAYAIHKSFIFVRVPLTAAVLPKVVRVLRAWGWKIGKPKSA